MRIQWGIVLVFFGILSTSNVYAEKLKCQGTTDDIPEVTTTITIEPRGMSPETRLLTVRASNETDDLRKRFSVQATVKRSRRAQTIRYWDQFDRKGFELVVQDNPNHSSEAPRFTGTLYLYQDRPYKQTIAGLSCTLEGEFFPPETPCPKEGIAGANAALILAAQYGSVESLDTAFRCGADANFRDQKGCTALLYVTNLACGYKPSPSGGGNPTHPGSPDAPQHMSRGSLEIEDLIRSLLSEGAQKEVRDPITQETPLLNVVKYRQLEAIDQLLEAGANIEAQDRSGNTPLIVATLLGDGYLVRAVLSGNPDLGKKNQAGETAYQIAQRKGLDELLDLLKPNEASSSVIAGQADGSCTPTMVHIYRGKPVEVVLRASTQMFLLAAPALGLELMAMPNSSVRKVITPSVTGTFPFTCGVHGAPESQQTHGSFMVM